MYKIHDAQRDESLEELISELYARLDGTDKSIEELEQRIGSIGGGPGGGDVPADYLERLEETRRRAELSSTPDHTAIIETGPPEGDYHDNPDWGVIIETERPVIWQSTQVDAEESGTIQQVVYEIDYERNNRYDLGDVHQTRELPVSAGRQTVYPVVYLPEGQHFITRKDSTPLRRVQPTVSWMQLNDAHDLPLSLGTSWQIGRQPEDKADWERYIDQKWDRILHYWANMEFAYMDG